MLARLRELIRPAPGVDPTFDEKISEAIKPLEATGLNKDGAALLSAMLKVAAENNGIYTGKAGEEFALQVARILAEQAKL